MWTAGNYKKQQNLLMFRWTAVPHACTSENAYHCHFLKHSIIEQIDLCNRKDNCRGKKITI